MFFTPAWVPLLQAWFGLTEHKSLTFFFSLTSYKARLANMGSISISNLWGRRKWSVSAQMHEMKWTKRDGPPSTYFKDKHLTRSLWPKCSLGTSGTQRRSMGSSCTARIVMLSYVNLWLIEKCVEVRPKNLVQIQAGSKNTSSRAGCRAKSSRWRLALRCSSLCLSISSLGARSRRWGRSASGSEFFKSKMLQAQLPRGVSSMDIDRLFRSSCGGKRCRVTSRIWNAWIQRVRKSNSGTWSSW